MNLSESFELRTCNPMSQVEPSSTREAVKANHAGSGRVGGRGGDMHRAVAMKDPLGPRGAQKMAALLLADLPVLRPAHYAIGSADRAPGLQKLPHSLIMHHPMSLFFSFTHWNGFLLHKASSP